MHPHLQYRILDDVYQSVPAMYDSSLLTLIGDYSKSVRNKYKNKKVRYIDNHSIKRTAKITDTTCSRYGIILDVKYKRINVYVEDAVYLCDVTIL